MKTLKDILLSGFVGHQYFLRIRHISVGSRNRARPPICFSCRFLRSNERIRLSEWMRLIERMRLTEQLL